MPDPNQEDDVRQVQEVLLNIADSFLTLCLEKEKELSDREKHKLQKGARAALRRARALPELVARGHGNWIGMTEQFVDAAGKLVLKYLGKPE